ncbi:MAG: FAD-binding oxidoreductase [Rhodobiaceae bacterium]|nr:FAD-binding oxidoreductase [Rhodobiaceae bacterium]
MSEASAYPPNSYYTATARALKPFAPLSGSVRADVVVIGGGYTGLSAALHLAQRGYDVVLLEAARVGWGASGRNGGQIHSGQRRDQATLEASLGLDAAKALWGLAEDAKALVHNLIANHAIDCDLTGGLIDCAHKEAYVADYRAEVDHLREVYGYEGVEFLDRAALREKVGSPDYHGGLIDHGAGHLHPLNFALGIAKAADAAGAAIHERSRVTQITRGKNVKVRTAAGEVTAAIGIVACNGYLEHLLPQVAARVLPINNFIAATRPLSDEEARGVIRDREAVSDSRFVINYYRLSADNRLLFGGGENYSRHFPADIAAFVRPHMEKIYPQLAGIGIDYAWGGTLAITAKRMPYVTRLDPNLYAACGFSGQGVTIAPLAGQLVAEAINGQMSRFDVFARLKTPAFPGGTLLRHPTMVLAMMWFALRDRMPF